TPAPARTRNCPAGSRGSTNSATRSSRAPHARAAIPERALPGRPYPNGPYPATAPATTPSHPPLQRRRAMLAPETITAIADELAQAEQTRTTVPLLTARHEGMTVEDAYAVQNEWRRRG